MTSELYDRLLNDGYDITDIIQAIHHYVTKTALTLDYIKLAEQDEPTEKSIKSWVNYLIDCNVLACNTRSYIEENEEHELDEVLDSIFCMLEVMMVHAIHRAKLEPNEEKYGVIVVQPGEDDVDRFGVGVKESLYQLHMSKLIDDIAEAIDTIEDLEEESKKLVSEYHLVAGIAKMNDRNMEDKYDHY